MLISADVVATRRAFSSEGAMEFQYRLLAAALTNAGTYHHLMGRPEEAIERYQNALQLRMRVAGPETDVCIPDRVEVVRRELEVLRAEQSETVGSSNSSASLDLYEHRSWEERGMVHIDCRPIQVPRQESDAIPLHHPTPYEDHRDSAITFYNMGLIHLEKQSIEKAGQLFVMASNVISVSTHPDIAASILNGLALVFYLQDKTREALTNLTEAVELEQIARRGNLGRPGLGQNGVDMNECLATTLSLLGRIHYQSGDFDIALRFCNQLLQLRRSTFGSNDIRAAASAYNCGLVLYEAGKTDEALEKCGLFLRHVSNWRELDRSYQRKNTASALHVAGIMHVENDRVTMGLKLLTLALEARIMVIGPDHIELAKTHLELGKLKRGLGHYVEAKMHYGEALRIGRNELGEAHKDVASIWVSIGHVHYCRGELDEALVIFNQAVRHIKSIIGEGSDLVPPLLNAIGNILLEQGETERAMEVFIEESRSTSAFDPSRARNFPMVLPFHCIGTRLYPAAAAA